jgi:lipoprotein-anchoring transpeptidase ErfK/SrfK
MSTTERPTMPASPEGGVLTPVPGQGIPPSRGSRGPWRMVRWSAAGLLSLLVAVTVGAVAIAAAWGGQLRDEDRLLPGTTVAGIDVSGLTTTEASDAIAAALAASLDAPVSLVHGASTWAVTPRELGAATDTDAVVAQAVARTHEATLWDLTRLRWLGPDVTEQLDVEVTVPDGAPAAFVAELAANIDHDPSDASVAWGERGPEVTPHATGEALDVAAAAELLAGSLFGADTELALPVAVLQPTVDTAAATAAKDAALAAIDTALDRVVTLRLGDSSWSTTPRELGASADGGAVLAAAMTEQLRTLASTSAVELPVELRYPDGSLTAFVARIAAAVDRAPVDATGTLRGGEVVVTPGRGGVALNRDDAVAALAAALRGEAEVVELTARTVAPSITTASFEQVLYLDQSARTLQLRRGDVVVREWSVAVGTNNSPTPTGTFVVGAKRYEPTWTNPAPTRWGRDMPARIGPGPDNPLGVRALNWNRPGGGDTLIRFHGTPNEASIGQAASNGCVRMFNRDVIELYDLVPSGTMIISAP